MKAAVCLYDGFCNFEFSVLLESLALADWHFYTNSNLKTFYLDFVRPQSIVLARSGWPRR
mgnify:CR=1 FL=1